MSHKSKPAPCQDRRGYGRAAVKRHGEMPSVGTEKPTLSVGDDDPLLPAGSRRVQRDLQETKYGR